MGSYLLHSLFLLLFSICVCMFLHVVYSVDDQQMFSVCFANMCGSTCARWTLPRVMTAQRADREEEKKKRKRDKQGKELMKRGK